MFIFTIIKWNTTVKNRFIWTLKNNEVQPRTVQRDKLYKVHFLNILKWTLLATLQYYTIQDEYEG